MNQFLRYLADKHSAHRQTHAAGNNLLMTPSSKSLTKMIWSYSDLGSDSLASLYDSTITELLDRQVPMRSVTYAVDTRRPCGSTMNVAVRSGMSGV